MLAIGDADGTAHILSLCPPLYDQTLQPKEREQMLLIFDREFRREKTLDVARRMGQKNETKKVKKETTGKSEKLEGQLLEITDEFFQEVAEDEEEREMIKQRGAQAQEAL
jgi:hypothetical protein